MKHMVAGFLFSDDGSSVALIHKEKPARFKDWWNGIGGHVEPSDVSARAAMSREFKEEAGVPLARWEFFARLQWVNDAKEVVGCVDFFRAFNTAALESVQTMTEEEVHVWSFDTAIILPKLWPNLKWLLPMARYEQQGRGLPYIITEDGANVHG